MKKTTAATNKTMKVNLIMVGLRKMKAAQDVSENFFDNDKVMMAMLLILLRLEYTYNKSGRGFVELAARINMDLLT